MIEIKVVCTGKGHHRERYLGHAGPFRPPLHRQQYPADPPKFTIAYRIHRHQKSSKPATQFGRHRQSPPEWAAGHWTYRFRCPSCHRDVPLTEIALAAILCQLEGAGVSRLDLTDLSE